MLTTIQGDCLTVVPRLDDPMEPIHLIYCDPPFNSDRIYLDSSGGFAFTDTFESLEEYVEYIRERMVVCWDVLIPGGSLVLHIDPKTSHYLKVALDAEFGRDNFTSEIVWRYRRWPAKTPNFQRIHDVLLRWVKPGSTPKFNQQYEPLAASTKAVWGSKKQRAVVVDGERTKSSTSEEESPGVPMGDVWDIGIIAPVSKERTGYPTQKPETLLERLILGLSNPGDTVLDPMCGSGTTLAVAHRLCRHAIGIDMGQIAMETTRNRCQIGVS